MIPYAGKDPWERQLWAAPVAPRPRSAIAYERFDLGWDTALIAQHMGISEAKALKLVTIERSKLLAKPEPYEEQQNESETDTGSQEDHCQGEAI